MRTNRIDNIEKYIIEHKSVTLNELCSNFRISIATLRRDLDKLMPRGTIEKVYGGVIAHSLNDMPLDGLISYSERNIQNADEKKRIAKLAASVVTANDTIYIDTGTSTIRIIDYLVEVPNLTIITNSILVASKALAFNNIKTIMLPGIINTRTASSVGNGCQEYLRRYHIQKAFMACTGVTEFGAANATPEEYEVKKVALDQSRVHYLLVDHSKFDKSALMVYSPLSNIDHVFTDQMPNQKYLKLFQEHDIKLSIAD